MPQFQYRERFAGLTGDSVGPRLQYGFGNFTHFHHHTAQSTLSSKCTKQITTGWQAPLCLPYHQPGWRDKWAGETNARTSSGTAQLFHHYSASFLRTAFSSLCHQLPNKRRSTLAEAELGLLQPTGLLRGSSECVEMDCGGRASRCDPDPASPQPLKFRRATGRTNMTSVLSRPSSQGGPRGTEEFALRGAASPRYGEPFCCNKLL